MPYPAYAETIRRPDKTLLRCYPAINDRWKMRAIIYVPYRLKPALPSTG